MNGHAHFFHWGVVQISAANLTVIVIMLVIFGLAVLLRLPGAGHPTRPARPATRPAPHDATEATDDEH